MELFFLRNNEEICTCFIHHVAISIVEFDQYVELFKKIGMNVQRTTGEAPQRQIWFTEGIQLKETSVLKIGNNIDHIALCVNNIEATVKIAFENGCHSFSQGENWFLLPNGIVVELIKK